MALLERLQTLHPKKIDLSLDRIKRLLEKLGNPEQKLASVIHVAGTNGKGSVTQYIRAALEAAGKRVHTYTSPHLVRFHERIRLAKHNGVSALIGEQQLVAVLQEVEKVNAGEPMTFFEITTAAAFLACQAKILHRARGIPAWRAGLVPWMLGIGGLAEGFGAFAIATWLFEIGRAHV